MDYWIVTEHKYPRFASLEDAAQERQRLIRRDGRQRRVLRCKPYLKAARNFPLMVNLLRNILRDGLTDTSRACGEQLLAAIGERHLDLARAPKDEICPARSATADPSAEGRAA